MKNTKLIYLNLLIISASVICFEIISTRISSVIFVNNYAFIILSLAILGLAAGGIYSYYKIKIAPSESNKLIFRSLILAGFSLILFFVCVTGLQITAAFLYFFLLFIPFFFFGIIYAQLFKLFAEYSFILYASDLAGAALGAIAPIFIIDFAGAPNSILLISILIFGLAGIYLINNAGLKRVVFYYSLTASAFLFIIFNGQYNILGNVPIGKFEEKDFYHVYPNAEETSRIIDSRWSIYGRSDLVQYVDQDVVRQLFIDGSAGSPMYRFDGNAKKPDRQLLELLIHQTSAIPYLFLEKNEKNSMLIIGPGGGREVLIGLFENVDTIRGIEINPDFINLVKDYKDFNGGIYTSFPNVKIISAEGRHYVKRSKDKYDLIVMALPSTEQVQSIDAFAANENYLLTVEAISDYLNILTDEGQLIFTLHNEWELVRIITTALEAFQEIGVDNSNFFNHIAIVEGEYTPTIVIKKNAFTRGQFSHWQNILKKLPNDLPAVTYLPYEFQGISNSVVNNLISLLKEKRVTLKDVIERNSNDISPCRDDKPYFYKVTKSIPEDYTNLFLGIIVLSLIIIGIPFLSLMKNIQKDKKNKINITNILLPLIIFICLGLGFMILEIALFQKLVLYLGSPTISLTILLCSLLIGMGTGSFLGNRILKDNLIKRLYLISSMIVVTGIIIFILLPYFLDNLLAYNLIYRVLCCFFLIVPFGFLLGIPFPTSIQLLKKENLENYVPWMYGVNGAMSVLGSVLAVISSMVFGYTPTFFVGLCLYLILSVILFLSKPYFAQPISLKHEKMKR